MRKKQRGFHIWSPVAVLFAVVALVLTAQASFGMEQSNQQVSQQLLAAYHYAFYLYDHAGEIAQIHAKAGYPSSDSLRRDLGLSSSEFALFGKAASDFRQLEQTTQAQIESVERADLLAHPNTRGLTPAAKAQIHSLFLAMRQRESDAIKGIHLGLDRNTAVTLDASTASLYIQARAQTRAQNILQSTSTPLLGQTKNLSSNRIQPEFSEPGNCLDEQEEDDECVDGGGSFDLEDCTCDGGAGGGEGGGGGGGTDPFPMVTVTSASAQYGQAFDDPITAIVASQAGSGIDAPTPTGSVDFSMRDPNSDPGTPAYQSGSGDLNSEGVATWSLAAVIATGSYNTTGEYSGDDFYESVNGTSTASVEKAESITTMTGCPSGTVTAGQSLTFEISVTWAKAPTASLGTAGVATPTGNASLAYSGVSNPITKSLSPLPGVPSTATVTVTITGTGSQTLTPSYGSDSNYQSSTGATSAGSNGECAITVS
jgi:hypothetical protein